MPRCCAIIEGMKSYLFSIVDGVKLVAVDGQPLQVEHQPKHYLVLDRLAGAILADAVNADAAALLSHEFQREVVDHCKDGEQITAVEIQEWVDSECALASAVQAGTWHTPDKQPPPPPTQLPFHTPKLLRVQRGLQP